jgi:integrase
MASIERHGPSWRAIWRCQGVKERTTWPSEELAIQAAEIAKAHRHNVTADWVYAQILGEPEAVPLAPAVPTLRAWCNEWLSTRTRITPATKVQYRRMLDRIFVVVLRVDGREIAFGELPLDKITATLIGSLINHLRSGAGRKAGARKNTTVTRYYAVLHGALRAAVGQHIPENPCDRSDFVWNQVEHDDTGEEHRVYLTPNQYQLLRNEFSGDDRLLVDTLFGTGARWSEVSALAAKHLVAPTRTSGPKLRIWRAWKTDGEGGRYLGTTKGRQKRTIGIDLELYEALAAHAEGLPPDALLLHAPGGGEVDYTNWYHRRWVRAVVRVSRCSTHPPANQAQAVEGAHGRCGDHGGRRRDWKPCHAEVLPGTTRCRHHSGPDRRAVSTCGCPSLLPKQPTPHDARHTHAAWLFADPEVPPLAISRRLGHATLAVTSEIYGGLMPSAEEATVAAITAARTQPKATQKKRSTTPRTSATAKKSPTSRTTSRDQAA